MKGIQCLVCKSNLSKYKCPICLLPFCSVLCNKKHKETSCTVPKREDAICDSTARNRVEYSDDTLGDDVELTGSQLHLLDGSDEVQRKLRDERVMAIVRRIDGAKNRRAMLEREMKDAAFLEFCDDILESMQLRQPDQQGKLVL